MFTGIVEEKGEVADAAPARLVVRCHTVVADSGEGASVSVNGVCLTVVRRSGDSLAFDLSDETAERTSLRRLAPGDPVNLERPVSLAARLGGHLVQGHVDATGEVLAAEPDGAGGIMLRIRIPEEVRRYVVEKGSLAVDGVSLTVAEVHADGATIAVIPHTLAMTTLGEARPGCPVNLEVDLVAKYVERLMEARWTQGSS